MGLIMLANRWWWMRLVNLGVVVVAVGAGVFLVVVVDVVDVVVVVGMTVVGYSN
jgi:asparagine N-glycosylation enzyme membrane subunit Stt3